MCESLLDFNKVKCFVIDDVFFLNVVTSLCCRWVIFNDQKVCASEKPPKDMGYLYFYRRVAD